jgi:hypothetical protein
VFLVSRQGKPTRGQVCITNAYQIARQPSPLAESETKKRSSGQRSAPPKEKNLASAPTEALLLQAGQKRKCRLNDLTFSFIIMQLNHGNGRKLEQIT